MLHADAALTPTARLALARLVVEDGWPIARAAEHYRVSWPMGKRWAARYAAMGAAGMTDRSSRPHRSPSRTPAHQVKRVVHRRCKQRLSPLAIAARTGMPASTVHAVLTRCRLHRLSHVDIRTGEVIRRYEHAAPGDLIHHHVGWTSRSSATSPTAVGGASWDGRRARGTAPPRPATGPTPATTR